MTTATEKRILNALESGPKTFSRLQDGSRIIVTLLRMIDSGKVTLLKTTKDYVWKKSIGGAISRKPVVQLTVEKNGKY
jgi:hypothetical protein